MFIDARTLPNGEKLTADLCIVGAGAAGITLAHELIGSGLTVILAEAGDEEPGMDPARTLTGLASPVQAPLQAPVGCRARARRPAQRRRAWRAGAQSAVDVAKELANRL